MVLKGITHLCIVACIIQFMLFGHWHLTLNFGKEQTTQELFSLENFLSSRETSSTALYPDKACNFSSKTLGRSKSTLFWPITFNEVTKSFTGIES